MSRAESAFCRSAPWRTVARRVVLPWALHGFRPHGDVLEIGAGSGAMAADLLATCPDARVTATDVDGEMVSVTTCCRRRRCVSHTTQTATMSD